MRALQIQYNMQQEISQYSQDCGEHYNLLLILRRVELSIGCLFLLAIILNIVIRKRYVYNTIKLLLFVCISDLLGMFVILLFDKQYTVNGCCAIDDQNANQAQCLREKFGNINDAGGLFCGAMAFVNLFGYSLGYFFAVLISYNVYCVLKDQHKNFMKIVLTNKFVLVYLGIQLILYLIPLILIFVDTSVAYGPAGFYFEQKKYIFFCGLFRRKQDFLFWIIYSLMLLMVFLIFIIHFLILMRNRTKINSFLDIDYMNSKQQFVLRSGNIAVIIFFVQLLNFIKQAITQSELQQTLQKLILIINYLFDLYPILIFVSYIYYTRQHDRSKLINDTLLSIQQNR